MAPTARRPTPQSRAPTSQQQARLQRLQQGVIDAELRASRRAILGSFRERLRHNPATLAADDFLALADRSIVETAIVIAARSITGVDACALRTCEAPTGKLRITRQHGLPRAFLDRFAAIDLWPYPEPLLIDDLTTSPIRRGQPSLDGLLAAGFPAVQAYPLSDGHGALLGLLSLHHRTTGAHPAQDQLAGAAAHALGQLPASRP